MFDTSLSAADVSSSLFITPILSIVFLLNSWNTSGCLSVKSASHSLSKTVPSSSKASIMLFFVTNHLCERLFEPEMNYGASGQLLENLVRNAGDTLERHIFVRSLLWLWEPIKDVAR